jgi:hypothetical protein
MKTWLYHRACYWLLAWVFLADALLEILTFGILDLTPCVEQLHE